ncbi:hypothetical protein GCM10010495_76420 [Kitasatospora herbaricolor]|uniref:hypothetical protein n=1 Tax=Kitasatospora herbaricolor TaxID=68217 RepID=UPI00174A5AF4|nr:hypothetical protein [Kitasatospora herbaricolor]MDQ0313530.1 protein-S-isoprenylcysteine O-methyltransferase Ste14 [Kitasatospora herbaricolor]GGV47440.1 hypothetical protein GCM10010495_76420 [Kitasatospora herbaricolor]
MPILTPTTAARPAPAPASAALPALLPLTAVLPALTGLFADRLATPATIALIGADLALVAAAGALVAHRRAGATTGAAATRPTDRARRDQETLDRLEPLRPDTPASATR